MASNSFTLKNKKENVGAGLCIIMKLYLPRSVRGSVYMAATEERQNTGYRLAVIG
jgi:hypothetical protein